MPQINFDANQQEESYDPLPAGDYMVWISESSIKQPRNGIGELLELVMDVMQPEQLAGRKIWSHFTLENPNPKAVEVGRRILANVCRAVGVMAPLDTEELHSIPFWARVEVKQLESGKIVNDCKAYWSTQSQAPPQPKSKPRAPQPQQQAFQPGPQTGYMPQGQQPWQAPQQAPQQPWQQPQAPQFQPAPQAPPQVPRSPQQAPQGYPPQYSQQPGQPPFPPMQNYQQQPPAQTPAPQPMAPQQPPQAFNPPVQQTPPPWAQPRAAAQPPQQQGGDGAQGQIPF
jgi:hypothetical protein